MKQVSTRWCFLIAIMLHAAQCQSKFEDYAFYMKIASGISVSQPADVVAVYPPWDGAYQGYDASLGHCAIAGFGIGAQFFGVLDLEVNISNRSIFEYNKYQTSTMGNGSYTREFDLNVTPILFSMNILGQGIPHCHLDFSSGTLYPMLGGSVGMSSLLMTNFRTTGLSSTGSSSPYESFSAENQYTMRKNFTYTVSTGFEYQHENRWAIGTGYRWLHAGNFQSPEYVRTNSGAAVDIADNQWQMHFRANEWFIEFKIFI